MISLSAYLFTSRQVKGLAAQSCPAFCDPIDCTRLLCPWNSLGKNAGVGCHSLLQGIFPTQGPNLGLLHCKQILYHLNHHGSSHVMIWQSFKIYETQVRSLGWEDPLEKRTATHSSVLAWRISWTEEPGALQSMGSQRVRHDWATNTSSIGENGNWKEKGEKKDFLHYTTLLERPTVGPTNQKE